MIDKHKGWNLSSKPLFIGYTLSVLLTLAAYYILTHEHLRQRELTLTLFGLAFVQVMIQMVFFLHIGVEQKPAWNLVTFLFTLLVVIIVIGGSLWIMQNLNYNLMVSEG